MTDMILLLISAIAVATTVRLLYSHRIDWPDWPYLAPALTWSLNEIASFGPWGWVLE